MAMPALPPLTALQSQRKKHFQTSLYRCSLPPCAVAYAGCAKRNV